MKSGRRREMLMHYPSEDRHNLAGGQLVLAAAARTVFLYCYLYTVVLYSLNPN